MIQIFKKEAVEKAVVIICNVCKQDEASLQLLQEEENLIATVSRLRDRTGSEYTICVSKRLLRIK